MNPKMYVIILYSKNNKIPYVYDVVKTSDELDEVIAKFGAVKFAEYNEDSDEDSNSKHSSNYLRFVDIDTSYKWYHISPEQSEILLGFKNFDMIIVEKKNYTVSEIIEDDMFNI